ncbi:TonB-dependent receptor [Roseateles violae]|uniref:TonB-dependent receptor n=1 Tax=Roseateles violae TaxID=3058042 RepID=A0ABT8DPQ6_9BURK|nr:TonB-dependent receptor [Pelomonas sp. PFR6]MDN3920337.1 TonB-dependent receptor [Pelomonas sp. PFR6]
MKFHRTHIASAVSLSLLGLMIAPGGAWAADTAPAAGSQKAESSEAKGSEQKNNTLEQVVVTGIRASLEKSIKTKRDADTNIEVVTAEDIGKMPDKNIADSLSRLSGVNVTHGAAFAFDEAERVQIRGTPPKLNLVTINGHSLSSGDWYLSDQNATTRAVGFGMLPSQLIGQSIVYKNGRADITEGGIGGAVDVITRKPLDLRQQLTGEVSLGAVYSTLADKVDPQLSALLGWKNEDKTFGVLVQAFREDRSLRRDGVENFGVTTLLSQDTTNPAKCITVNGSQVCGNAELKGKRLPGNLASALFEGERKRHGGFLSAQFKPSNDLDMSFSVFQSSLDASNYNSNTFTFANNMLNGAGGTTANGAILSNYKIVGDVVTAATINPNPARLSANGGLGDIAVQSGHQVRSGAGSSAGFYDFDFKLRANDRLVFNGKVGHTEGTGETESSPGMLFRAFNKPITYQINGDQGLDWSVANVNLRDLTQGGWHLISDIQAVFKTKDQDTYLYLNGEYDTDAGILTKTKFGMRAGKHRNEKDQINGAWNFMTTGTGTPTQAQMDAQFPVSTFPMSNAGYYPADYGSGLNGNFPKDVLRLDRGTMLNVNSLINYDPVLNKNWAGSYIVNEKTEAFYLMQEFESGALSGNAGVRLVGTEVNSIFYQALPANRVCPALAVSCPPQVGTPVQNPIASSRLSGYMQQEVTTHHTDLLPSMNLRWDLDSRTIARASASRTMARPEYSELAGAISGLNNNVTPKSASGGNPNLEPTTSNNLDASLAWFANSRAYVQGSVFTQHMHNYVKRGTAFVNLKNPDTQEFEPYLVNSFQGRKAKLKGLELSGESPIGGGFGIVGNVTLVDGVDQDGAQIIGTSKWTYNLRGYYESGPWTATLAWNQRSAYPVSYFGNGTISDATATAARNGLNYADAQGSLAASISYRINDNMSVVLDGTNLLNPTYYYYSITPDMPLGWYKNGRQVFLNLRAKF